VYLKLSPEMGAAPGEQWIFQYHPQNGRQLCTEEANLKDIEESLDNVASAISSGWKSLWEETDEDR
jgi:hypothetical protein